MIRLKNRQYPFWIQWDGTEENYNKVKNIIEDHIKENGFDHFDALVDLVDEKDTSGTRGDKAFGFGTPASQPKTASKKKSGKTVGGAINS